MSWKGPRIQVGSAIARALTQVVTNQVQMRSGLFVPADYIAGRHFGGFDGYATWIQDCIRASCLNAREIGPDELSELTSVAMWTGGGRVEFTIQRHADALVTLERFADRIPGGGLTSKFLEQIRRADGTRERGTLLVVALNPMEVEDTGELKGSVSAWSPASVEEAEALPKQKIAGEGWLGERAKLGQSK